MVPRWVKAGVIAAVVPAVVGYCATPSKDGCDTEAANFEASGGDEAGKAGIKGPRLQALLTVFAQDQMRRHGGCGGLALPGRERPVPKQR